MMEKKKDEIKFVFNFHCAGKIFVTPYSGEIPNALGKENPNIKSIFKEIINEAQFPLGTDIGPSTDNM